jgi:hypothetical protein
MPASKYTVARIVLLSLAVLASSVAMAQVDAGRVDLTAADPLTGEAMLPAIPLDPFPSQDIAPWLEKDGPAWRVNDEFAMPIINPDDPSAAVPVPEPSALNFLFGAIALYGSLVLAKWWGNRF